MKAIRSERDLRTQLVENRRRSRSRSRNRNRSRSKTRIRSRSRSRSKTRIRTRIGSRSNSRSRNRSRSRSRRDICDAKERKRSSSREGKERLRSRPKESDRSKESDKDATTRRKPDKRSSSPSTSTSSPASSASSLSSTKEAKQPVKAVSTAPTIRKIEAKQPAKAVSTAPVICRKETPKSDSVCPYCKEDLRFALRLEIHKLWKHVDESYQELQLQDKFSGTKPEQLSLLGQILSTIGGNSSQLAPQAAIADDGRQRDKIGEASVYLSAGSGSFVGKLEPPPSLVAPPAQATYSSPVAKEDKSPARPGGVRELAEQVLESSKEEEGLFSSPPNAKFDSNLLGDHSSLFTGYTFFLKILDSAPSGTSAEQIMAKICDNGGRIVVRPWDLKPAFENVVLIVDNHVAPPVGFKDTFQEFALYNVDVLHIRWLHDCVAQGTLLRRTDYRFASYVSNA
uniref:BRCT domain-containing protein n=1 Tax=Plectus sambesii TaxID=2011161 RepID=A0A914W1V6_9BILA